MKVVFMGTPDFAVPCLEKLFEANYEIPLVITQPDKPKGRGKSIAFPPVKEKAIELDLKVCQPQNVNSPEMVSILQDINPDVIAVVAFGQILKEDVLNLPRYGCINVHASLLPQYRGAAPINWVIINGENKTGITTMKMDRGLDTGDMLVKKEIPIEDKDNAGDLHDKLMALGAEVLLDTLKAIKNDEITPTPQNNSLSSYAPIMSKELGRINWNLTAEEIKNLVRGTFPWPGAYFIYGDYHVKVLEVEACEAFKEGKPGEVVKVDNKGIYINTKSGCLVIKKLQFPGKKKMYIEDFLRGNNFDIGIVLD